MLIWQPINRQCARIWLKKCPIKRNKYSATYVLHLFSHKYEVIRFEYKYVCSSNRILWCDIETTRSIIHIRISKYLKKKNLWHVFFSYVHSREERAKSLFHGWVEEEGKVEGKFSVDSAPLTWITCPSKCTLSYWYTCFEAKVFGCRKSLKLHWGRWSAPLSSFR